MKKGNLRIEFHRGFPCNPSIFTSFLKIFVWLYLSEIVCAILYSWLENRNDWLYITVLLIPMLLYFGRDVLSWFDHVSLEPDGIRVIRFGRTAWFVPVEDIRLICTVGDMSSQDLCVSSRSLDELAAERETSMKKSLFLRSSIAYEKNTPQWQSNFSREYLNRMRRKTFRTCLGANMLFLPMEMITQTLLCRMYPQVPYVNLLTEKRLIKLTQRTDGVPLFSVVREDQIGATAEADGIHITKKGEPYWIFSREKIRTIACVDRYRDNPKGEALHTPLLVISTMSIDEMGMHDKTNLIVEGGKLTDFPWGKELLATQYCLSMASVWRGHGNELCVMYRTKVQIENLKKLYPDAQWLDISGTVPDELNL